MPYLFKPTIRAEANRIVTPIYVANTDAQIIDVLKDSRLKEFAKRHLIFETTAIINWGEGKSLQGHNIIINYDDGLQVYVSEHLSAPPGDWEKKGNLVYFGGRSFDKPLYLGEDLRSTLIEPPGERRLSDQQIADLLSREDSHEED